METSLKEEIEKAVMPLDTGAFCNCHMHGKPVCKRHKAFVELATSLVTKALQEAEQRIEGERVSEDENCKAVDYTYSFNNGVEHALASLRELRESLKD